MKKLEVECLPEALLEWVRESKKLSEHIEIGLNTAVEAAFTALFPNTEYQGPFYSTLLGDAECTSTLRDKRVRIQRMISAVSDDSNSRKTHFETWFLSIQGSKQEIQNAHNFLESHEFFGSGQISNIANGFRNDLNWERKERTKFIVYGTLLFATALLLSSLLLVV